MKHSTKEIKTELEDVVLIKGEKKGKLSIGIVEELFQE